MNAARTFEVFRQEFSHNLRRPLFWVQIALLGFLVFMLSSGKAQMSSGDARVGGHKAWITSEFALTQMLVMLISILYVFFVSVAAGMAVIRDDEQKVGELLHSTPLRPSEYVWGKYLAVLASFVGVLAVQVGWAMFCNHALPHGTNAEFIGPFAVANYLRPAFVFAIPTLVLFTGACFAIGGLSRMPVLVFAFPIGVLLLDAFFLWDWSPSWLPLVWNRVLQFVDPTGLRWLKETWLLVDRGVDFYNHAPVGLDTLVIVQRVVVLSLGLVSVAVFQYRFGATLRGVRASAKERAAALEVAPRAPEPYRSPLPSASAPMAALGMRTAAPSVIGTVVEVARAELHQLVRAPGLYLFVPLILIQTLLNEYGVGAFDTPVLNTAGTLATGMMNTLTLLVCMVILFYTTESLQRERSTGFGSIYFATPLRTSALIAGKALANTTLAMAIVLACFLGCLVVLAVQGQVPLDPLPFVIVWGLLLVPTYLVWSTFVTAVYAATSNRYSTYAIGLATMALSGWFQMRGRMNWVFNWDLWSATRWTDLATFQYDALPLALNRTTWLLAAVLFAVLSVRLFERRERDSTNTLLRLRPGAMARSLVSLAPFLLLPLVPGTLLGLQVHQGYQGPAASKATLDYWRKNIQTWKDAPTPSLAGVDLDVRFDPPRNAFAMKGSYLLENETDRPLARFPVTVNPRWKKLAWTLDAKACSTESRAGLVIVTPHAPLPPGGRVRLGFTYDGRQPDGISKNGGYGMEFITPSSIVLTGFGTTFTPTVGFFPDEAVEEDKNASDPREWPEDWWKGINPGGIPSAGGWYDVHMKVDVPAALTVNATGEKVAEVVMGGRRVTEWRTDRPVRIFNLIAGRWKVKQGDGIAVYYDARHPYNVDEMFAALEGARRWYGEWFAPYPWKTLRLSEFAGWPTYAQAPAGNISFSEGIGFLTRSKPDANAAFWIAAHESAHMWWPNMAMVADGPGCEVLSEGMAHFSTLLLVEKARGEQQRQAFARQMESRYGRLRRADSERALVKIDGKLPGDTRIWYDKGGWALWMLHRFMGPQRGLPAIREYMATFRDSRDHASLEDYLAIHRRYAADTTAFDAFTKQWFFTVVVPHYLIEDARLESEGKGWKVTATTRNAGSGAMTVDIAAAKGERWPAKGKPAAPYIDARQSVTLTSGERATVTIRCDFRPERLVIDPDITVLMLERNKAEVKLSPERGAVAAATR